MGRELYIDISSENSGGSLYRITEETGIVSFLYEHSTYDDQRDEVKAFKTVYPDFAAFWKKLTTDPEWYYQHPLFVHPEQRDFIRRQLDRVNWSVHPDRKWQESHQRQWKKVLTDPGNYYQG